MNLTSEQLLTESGSPAVCGEQAIQLECDAMMHRLRARNLHPRFAFHAFALDKGLICGTYPHQEDEQYLPLILVQTLIDFFSQERLNRSAEVARGIVLEDLRKLKNRLLLNSAWEADSTSS